MQALHESMEVREKMQPDSDLAKCGEGPFLSGHPVNSENAVIAARLRACDPEIIEELISRYQERLRRYLVRITSDRELAEDVLQETWMRVLTRGSQFKGESQFTTWLYAVARNLVRDLRRRKQPQIGSLETTTNGGDPFTLEIASQEKTPFEYYANSEHARILADAFRMLMPYHREVLELRFHHEMSLSEISLEIGAPVSTVKARLYRATVMLRPKVRAALST